MQQYVAAWAVFTGIFYLNSTDQKVHFDEERCSKECLEKLRVMGMNTKGFISGTDLSYKKLDTSFKQGQILHNFNNRDYRVTPFEKEGSNIRGLVRIYFDDCFVVNNASVIKGKE